MTQCNAKCDEFDDVLRKMENVSPFGATALALGKMTISMHGMRVTSGVIDIIDVLEKGGATFTIELGSGERFEGLLTRDILGICSVTVDGNIWASPVVFEDSDLTSLFARHVIKVLTEPAWFSFRSRDKVSK